MRRTAFTLLGVLAVSVAVIGLVQPAQAESYRVKKGDTLSGIAHRFKTTVSQLAGANGIKDTSRIAAGRVLQIPSTSPPKVAAAPAADNVPRGYDVSYPQCGAPLPGRVAFAVVGVNAGRPNTVNPCLAQQAAWASAASDPQRRFYINTSNPCTTPSVCGYDFGQQGARFAASQVAKPFQARWWLDVETLNSWSSNPASNLAAVRGAIDYFTGHGAQVGIYSTTYQWSRITGGAAVPGIPVWIAGGGDYAAAVRACAPGSSFSGGRVAFTQYRAGAYDADHRC